MPESAPQTAVELQPACVTAVALACEHARAHPRGMTIIIGTADFLQRAFYAMPRPLLEKWERRRVTFTNGAQVVGIHWSQPLRHEMRGRSHVLIVTDYPPETAAHLIASVREASRQPNCEWRVL